ncbi:hypothetical protein [Streptomyces sp. NPDC089795]|uniref:hypothetical protein n=1 Tax=Streptomyces sp. NPDC089795 TaxID=3155297 RepID=UPI00342D4FFC
MRAFERVTGWGLPGAVAGTGWGAGVGWGSLDEDSPEADAAGGLLRVRVTAR